MLLALLVASVPPAMLLISALATRLDPIPEAAVRQACTGVLTTEGRKYWTQPNVQLYRAHHRQTYPPHGGINGMNFYVVNFGPPHRYDMALGTCKVQMDGLGRPVAVISHWKLQGDTSQP